MTKLVWFVEPHISKDKDKRILINLDNITCIVPSDEREDETLIYFNGNNCIRVRGTVEEVYKTIELA